MFNKIPCFTIEQIEALSHSEIIAITIKARSALVPFPPELKLSYFFKARVGYVELVDPPTLQIDLN